MLDRFRWQAEQCDSMQGVQCVFDTDSAFSGMAASFLQVNDNTPPIHNTPTFYLRH